MYIKTFNTRHFLYCFRKRVLLSEFQNKVTEFSNTIKTKISLKSKHLNYSSKQDFRQIIVIGLQLKK